MVGHKASGEFDPRFWFALTERGEPRGMNSGRAVQGVHFQAGIVSEHERKRRVTSDEGRVGGEPPGEFDGFFGGVAGEGFGVLDDGGCAGKIIEREKLELAAQNGADFPDLVRVACGDEQCCHAGKIPAAGFRATKGNGRRWLAT